MTLVFHLQSLEAAMETVHLIFFFFSFMFLLSMEGCVSQSDVL